MDRLYGALNKGDIFGESGQKFSAKNAVISIECMHLFDHKPHTSTLFCSPFFSRFILPFFLIDSFGACFYLLADIHQIVLCLCDVLLYNMRAAGNVSRLTVISTRIVTITNKSHLQNRNEQPEYIDKSQMQKQKMKRTNEILIHQPFDAMRFVSAVTTNRMSKMRTHSDNTNEQYRCYEISFDTIDRTIDTQFTEMTILIAS